jgi:hypothetical protein
MKKIVLSTALAAAIATAGIPSTPARADGGATAAIIVGSVILGSILWHAHGWGPHPWPYHPWFAPPPPPPPMKKKYYK